MISTPEPRVVPVALPTHPVLPASATHYGGNLTAIAIVLVATCAMRTRILPATDAVLILSAALVIPVVLFDVLVLRVHRRASTGLDWDKAFTPSAGRVATKLLGLLVTLAPFAVAYWAIPEYGGTFYDPFYGTLKRFGFALLAVAVAYVWLVDGRMKLPCDVYWQLGRLVLGSRRDANGAEIANHYRGWLVKAYFLALFCVWDTDGTHAILVYPLTGASWSSLRVYDFVYNGILYVDVLMATVGYTMTFRAIDTHIRSAEPTMTGWVVALFCYEPFFSFFERQYVHYGDQGFESWLAPYPTFRTIWGGVSLALLTVYVLATVAFGVRFSNLTHRGILTNGPYRFSKHPAYVAKNLSWWMSSVPFVSTAGVSTAIKHCLLLGAVNFIYFMRAKTEERHLSRDPTYVAYATWMNEHGVLAFIGRRLPIFRYRAPEVTS
jgi:protein-S-isoprenylcysteine O-methyltransferase Ste14